MQNNHLPDTPRAGVLDGVDTPASEPAPTRRARFRRWFPLGLLALVVLVALAPYLSAPLLRGLVVDALEDRLDAEARVQSVSFAWPAQVRVRGLELTDQGGAPLAALDELSASFELWPLLSGRVRAEVELSYPEFHVSRLVGGRWNWEQPLAKPRPPSGRERDDAEAGALPDVRAHLRIADGHVRVHGPNGDTTLGDIQLEVDVDGLDRPAPYRLALGVRGPQGPAGGLTLEGSFTAAAGGRIDAAGMTGAGKLELQELELAGLAPALELLAGADGAAPGLAGVLSGKAEFTLGTGLALVGNSDIELRDLAIQGPLAQGAPTRIGRVELRGRATQQGEGAGSQHFELKADSFLSVTYEGRSRVPALGAGEIGGTLTLAADLAPLAAIARGWVPLQAGIELQGRVETGLELAAALVDRRPTSARLVTHAGIAGLAARDAAGRALDLAQLPGGLALELEAAADLEHATLSVPKFDLQSGSVSCSGNLEATGFALDPAARALALRACELRLAADLEQLRGTLSQIVELEGKPFGGRLNADCTLSGAGEALELAARVDGNALSFAGLSLAELDGQLEARRAQDGVLAGSGTLRLGALALRLAEHEPIELPGATVELTLREDAAGHGAHVLGLRTSDGALALRLQAGSERKGGELALQTSLALDARVTELARLATPFAPMQPGLSGDLVASGELSARVLGGSLASAGGRLQLSLTDLRARDAAGAPLALEALARTTLALEGEVDVGADRAELRAFTLTAGGLELSGSGHVTALSHTPRIEDGKLALQADLARLGPELARVVDLAGWSVSGSPLTADVQLSTEEQRVQAGGRLALATLRLAGPERPPLVLADVGLDFDLGYDAALGSLHVRQAAARSSMAVVRLSGTLNELLAPERARGAMQLELEGELGRILGDLGLEAPESGRRTAGKLGAKLALEGDGGAFRVTGMTTIERFRLELAPAAEGEAPMVVEEPSITIDCNAAVTLAALDVDLTRLTLAAELARGGIQGRIENLRALALPAAPEKEAGDATEAGEVRFVGLKGQFAYVPDRVGAVLAPLLPGKLSGAEEQRLDFTLDGRARDFALATLLAGSQAHMSLGIGRFTRPEIELDGALTLEVKDETLRLHGDLGANGGSLQLDGELGLARDDGKPRSKLTLNARAVRANAGLAPLLAYVHPAFGAAELAQGSLDGLIGLSLDLNYAAPLTLEDLGAGWEALPKEPIHGAGRLELSEAALRGSPLLGLLGSFGVDASRTLAVRPIEFTIQKGRVTYARPWTWTFADTETSFSGSLGLDQTLDLAWNIPISDQLIGRWGFLASLKGERLSIPLRGSVQKPRLEADEILKDLAAKVAQGELESRLGLGGKASGDDPATLLERADSLWSKGQKAEAAALYLRLREDFKLSLPYALNKDRIKERSKYKEPPR